MQPVVSWREVMPSKRRALVIVGHGSQRNPNTRKPICQAVQAIRARGLYDEVRCALWKEEPHVSTLLDALSSDEITIVPYFISRGYYTEEVIPREMKLAGPLTHREGKIIRYTEPVGGHPLLADLIVQQALAAGADAQTTLAVLGHGTPRNPQSAENVYLQAERVRAQGRFAEVVTVFIDQEPFVQEIFERAAQTDIVMVPLFIADGWHVTETIPEDLRLASGEVTQLGKTLRYTPAVGTDIRMVDVILELADACG
ncbi:MAG: sirohydrochlorin cobaltochelatase [Kiritimatiellia bacterium]|jgi:sirohydrochlorin cobaltochelatase